MADDKHKPILESDFLTPGWRGACTCGWTGENKATINEAECDFRAHAEEASHAHAK